MDDRPADQDASTAPGAILRDVTGEALGTIVEVHPGHIEVEHRTGPLGLTRRTYVIARDRIDRVDGDDWYLAISRDELEHIVQAAHDVDPRANLTPGPPAVGSVLLWAEQLDTQVVPVQVGEAVLRKEIVEEVRTVEVPLRREVLHIERYGLTDEDAIRSQARPSDAPRGGGPWEPRRGTPEQPLELRADTIRVPVVHEELVIQVVPRVVEEVVITKEVVQETVSRAEPVRVERAVVEETRLGAGEGGAARRIVPEDPERP
jgi:stress response protein YsnF